MAPRPSLQPLTVLTFIDTNVLAYAHDASERRRQPIAAALIDDLWRSREGVVSTQVLTEFYVVGEFALNRDAKGGLVAAFPFDGLDWSETAAKSLSAISTEVATRGESTPPLFATTGKVSATAQAELKKRGWKLVTLE